MAEEIKKRLTSIFNFMKEVNAIRNPVKTDIEEQEWKLNFDELPEVDEIKTIHSFTDTTEESDYILKIKKPFLITCPDPDKILIDWLKPGWNKLYSEPEVLLEKPRIPNTKELIEKFEDDDLRIEKYQTWIEERNEWKEKEIPKDICSEIYSNLYSLYSKLQKEAEILELVIGDGILEWNLDNGRKLNHPIIIQNLELEFNAEIPEFIVKFSDRNSNLYTALFRNLNEVNQTIFSKYVEECMTENYQIFQDENTEVFLKKLSRILSDKGEYSNNYIERKDKKFPFIYRKPIIFLRKRNLGFTTMINSILEDIPIQESFSNFVSNIVGIPKIINENINLENININGQDKEIFLTKPANKEQLYVAKTLEHYNAVLVQGPPGTGKTHTIANLVGHLLSEGKSVLITSHTEKALKVLKEKVVESLQSLCLSVMSNKENRSEMEKTLNDMNLKHSTINSIEIAKEIEELTERRNSILEKLEKERNELKFSRMDEYRDIIINGDATQPVEAAKLIKESNGDFNIIPSPIEIGQGLNLTNEEIVELYNTNNTISKLEEKEIELEIPEIDELISPALFEEYTIKINDFDSYFKNIDELLWNNDKETDIGLLEEIIEESKKILADMKQFNEVEIKIINSSIEMGNALKQWKNILDLIEDTKKALEEIVEDRIDYEPYIQNEIINEEKLAIINEIVDYLKNNKKINKVIIFFKKQWKEVIEKTRIKGKAPEKLKDFEIIKKEIELSLTQEKLIKRWNHYSENEEEYNYDLKEDKVKKILFNKEIVKNNLRWYTDKWITLTEKIGKTNFLFSQYKNSVKKPMIQNSEFFYLKELLDDKFISNLEYKIKITKISLNKKELNKYVEKLNGYYNKNGSIIFRTIESIKKLDYQTYSENYQEILNLNNKRKIFIKRKEYLKRLKIIAPKWAENIENRFGTYGECKPPKDIEYLWKLKQLNEEIEKRNEKDISKIQNKIASFEEELRGITEKIVEKKAWNEKIKKITLEQLQSIEGWRLTMRKIGKGKGKRAPKLLAEARKLMTKCQTAVPVWIMPLNKVVENFNPKDNKFDVVIIDEASQADIMELNAIYLGKQIVIVGDDEQVSPSAVGQKLDDMEALIQNYLQNIPNNHLYTGDLSIYDIAKSSGFKPITLTEHFRCLEPIIEFSNHLSYDGRIKPLRDMNNFKLDQAVIEYVVGNGVEDNKINREEIEIVTSLIIASLEFDEYKDKTFGIISLLGERQANEIDKFLQHKMNEKDYFERKIQCGNSSNFQGDERDVIFLSMVSSSSGEGPLRLMDGYGRNGEMKKRYNVATSRAKDQMWVIHSLNPMIDLKEGDIRLRLINHAKNPYEFKQLQNNLMEKGESIFEREVIKMLTNKGYSVEPQKVVGAYRIDMIVEGNGKKLAVECDGEKWHGPEKMQDDLNRQAILERLGWRFERIRGSEFFRNPEKAMEKVYKRLENMGIGKEFLDKKIKKEFSSDLINRIKARATEIRNEWKEEINNE